MAAIMDNWLKINQQCRKIGEVLSLEIPPVLYRVEGDVWARQNQRLEALSNFLQDVAGAVETIKNLADEALVSNADEALVSDQPKSKWGRGKTKDLSQDT